MILISGPCVIEGREILFKIAKELEEFSKDSNIDFFFKASFDKANRTSLESFRGIGFEEGLRVLDDIKKEFGYKILTDIHETSQVKAVSEVADVLQIPAFLCRQTDLLVECAKSDRVVNIKKGQFMNPKDMKYSCLKVAKTRGVDEATYESSKQSNIWLTERGSSFGYSNLVVDMRGLVIMREFAPVIFDATHSVQMPGGADGKSSGDSSFVPYLSRAAAGVGVDGFFFETHFDTKIAKSDSANMIEISALKKLVGEIKEIQKIVK
jgi:2-dehydro-3-deoxyphosphooctonate aldolase (KDO 8-P synthase)